MQKTGSSLVCFGLSRFFSNLHPHIGGHYPVLYFNTQITKKYSTAMCYLVVHFATLTGKHFPTKTDEFSEKLQGAGRGWQNWHLPGRLGLQICFSLSSSLSILIYVSSGKYDNTQSLGAFRTPTYIWASLTSCFLHLVLGLVTDTSISDHHLQSATQ